MSRRSSSAVSSAAASYGILLIFLLHLLPTLVDSHKVIPQKPTAVETTSNDVQRAEDEEPRYDLVLALIEKYLKEKTIRKNEKIHFQNSTVKGCNNLTVVQASRESQSIIYPTKGTYLSTEECVWFIRAPRGQRVELTIKRISIEATEGCRWDQLEIFDGESPENATRLTLLCGFVLPGQTYVSTSGTTVVRFTSDENIEYGGFHIDFRFKESGGVSGTPPPLPPPPPPPPPFPFPTFHYPSPPPFLSSTPYPQTPYLTPTSNQNQITKSSTNPPKDPVVKSGATTEYSECNGEIKELKLKHSAGVIRFPLSGEYENNLVCRWRITASPGKIIELTVPSIDIEASDDCHDCCSNDSLNIYDGREETESSRFAKLCGTTAPSEPAASTSNTVLVVFRTNEAVGQEGFQLNYQSFSKDKPLDSLCSGNGLEFRTPSGRLESPGFQEKKFPSNSKCKWRISAPDDQVIKIRFNSLSLENDVACLYDSVTIYDGPNRTSSLVGKYCGSRLPQAFTSHGPNIYVVFVSDDNRSDGGFSFDWVFIDRNASDRKQIPGCSGKPLLLEGQNEGVFTSPNYGNGSTYPNEVKCSWMITVNESLRVFVRFEKFSIEPPLMVGTCYDVLTVYDGPDPTSNNKIGSYCGINSPGDLLASSNKMLITFTSDRSNVAPGFLARFNAKRATRNAVGFDCGVSDVMPKIYTRIVGGVEANPHSWPWQVSVKFSGHEWKHWCGGSIISKRWILTAAHCVYGYGTASEFRVVLGEHNRWVDEGTEKETDVESLIVHELYDPFTADNDIALFKLPFDIEFNRNMKPICLPRDDVEPNTLCIVTGWGDTKSTGNDTILNQVYVPVLSRLQCNQPSWYNGQLTDNMMCAGFPEGRKDSCQGDSGGPMVCLNGGQWHLNGLTSWGMECAESNHPGVYTRIPRYISWIQSKTGVTP